MAFVIVFQDETDGPMRIIENLTMKQVENEIKVRRLTSSDYAIIEGKVIKNFDEPL